MIDIHSHILPGLDDGAADLSQAVEMAQLAVAEGIHTIIATPHHRNGRYDNPAQVVEKAVARLVEELKGRQIALTVLPGQEVRSYRELLPGIEAGEVMGLHRTKYLLLELPSRGIPEQLDADLHELGVMGIVPIIAHPERNREIVANPDRLLAMIERGALSQVTAHSLNGGFGARVQRDALELCRRRLVHFVASDAHHPQLRPFGLQEAYELIAHRFGEQEAFYYRGNAEAVIRGGDIDQREGVKSRKKRWYIFWRRSRFIRNG